MVLIRGDKWSFFRNSYPRESNFIRRILTLVATNSCLPVRPHEGDSPLHRLPGIGHRRPLIRGSHC